MEHDGTIQFHLKNITRKALGFFPCTVKLLSGTLILTKAFCPQSVQGAGWRRKVCTAEVWALIQVVSSSDSHGLMCWAARIQSTRETAARRCHRHVYCLHAPNRGSTCCFCVTCLYCMVVSFHIPLTRRFVPENRRRKKRQKADKGQVEKGTSEERMKVLQLISTNIQHFVMLVVQRKSDFMVQGEGPTQPHCKVKKPNLPRGADFLPLSCFLLRHQELQVGSTVFVQWRQILASYRTAPEWWQFLWLVLQKERGRLWY